MHIDNSEIAHAEVILVGNLVEEGGNTETVAFSGCRSGRDVVEAKQTLGRDLVVARSGDLLTPGAAPLGRTRDVRNLERRLGASGGLDEPRGEWSIGHLRMVGSRNNSLGRGENESEVALEVFGDGVGKSTELSLASLVDRILVVVRLEEVIGLADRDLEREPISGGGYPRRLDPMRAQPLINRLGCLRRGRSKRFNL